MGWRTWKMPFPPPPKALRDQLHQLETKLLTEEANKGQNPEPPQKKTFLLDFSRTDTKDDAYDVINAEIGYEAMCVIVCLFSWTHSSS